MKIGILLKQVPDTETKIQLTADKTSVDTSAVKWIVNPYDENAIEAAIQLKEKKGGEVIVFSMGPARCVDAMRTALAMGADRAVRVDTADGEWDSYTTAVALAEALKAEGVELVFAGKQAIDDDASQMVQLVAERMGAASLGIIETFELSEDGKSATVTRPVSGGTKEIIQVTLPAVFGCDKGLNTPRYASLPGIMKAKAKPVVEKKGAELLGGETIKIKKMGYSLPPERQPGRKLTGSPQELVDGLVKFLKEDVKII
ncbi:MAG: electron transfer flavoprotein subunit beta [Deltaproteobacteria bacterium CG11_big_fil_rev_8_21_14_0_20_47_16]|nr:MAG: electron transfer flavoprotein subunit beta [Deltaproteobacteria bacterium CG11_big_fil_rev_8_21_14_0_20_47_16]